MGIIKKLFGRELVGWDQASDTEVYPITHVGAVYDDNDVPLSTLLKGIDNRIDNIDGTIQHSAINYLWAFTVASSDAEAASKLNVDEQADVPTNYRASSAIEIQEGQYLYMTTARKQGTTYLVWENNHIWSSPVRMGSGYTTSTTGNDGNGYNYVYCRTKTDTPPVKPIQLTVANIEAITDKTYGISVEGTISNREYNVWYDHPLGVSDTYQYEWIAVAQGNDTDGWSSYEGPILWSKWGVVGRDGDGIEFIFTKQALTAEPPAWGDTYTGRIGEHGAITYPVNRNYIAEDEHYQTDDFIPVGWHDEPQDLDYNNPIEYVSIRKKTWDANEDNSKWGQFSTPVMWSRLTETAYTVTLDNDAVVADDDTSSQTLKNISYTSIHVWNGNREITTDEDFYIEVIVTSVNNANQQFKVNVVNKIENNVVTTRVIEDTDYIVQRGFNFAYPVPTYKADVQAIGKDELVLCISKANDEISMLEGNYALNYHVNIYADNTKAKLLGSIERKQTIKIVDINDGTGYMLLVYPNTLPISRENAEAPYMFNGSSATASIRIMAVACRGEDEVSYCDLHDSNAANDGELYVVITPYDNQNNPKSRSFVANVPSGNPKELDYTLSGLDQGCWYYVADLYLMHEGVAYNIDTETIDLSVKGDDGENACYITMTNDSAVIDDQTTGAEALKTITLNQLTVYDGSTNITNNEEVTFAIESSNLPSSLEVVKDAVTKNLFYIQPTASIGNTIPIGDYYYIIAAKLGTKTIASKVFSFLVRDITIDGTSFTLNITNDVWEYSGNSHEYIGAESYSQLTVSAIKSVSGGLEVTAQSFGLVADNALNSWTPSGSGYPLVVTYPATYAGLINTGAKTVRASSTYIRGPLDFKLYYKPAGQAAVIVDSEVIDTLEHGKDGLNGESTYTLSFDNDIALIDDQTVDNAVLRIATENNITLQHGETTLEFGADYDLFITYLNMPTGMKLVSGTQNITSNIGTSDTPVQMNAANMYFQVGGSTTPSNWPKSTYAVIVQAKKDEVILDSRKYKMLIEDISADGSIYKLNIANDVWTYDGDDNILGTQSSTFKVTKVGKSGNDVAYLEQTFTIAAEGGGGYSTTGFTVTYPSSLSGKVSVNSAGNLGTVNAIATYNTNVTTHTLKLFYKGVFTGEAETIQCSRNGKNGESGTGVRGAVVRSRGEWKSNNVQYCYNTDDNGVGPSEDNIVFIDYVYYGGHYYQCKETHSSSTSKAPGTSGGSSYWILANEFDFVATKVLVADSADVQVLSSGSIVVKDENQTIVGGMTGGTSSSTNDVIIWAGGNTPTSNNTKFKVYEDGNVDISGTIRASAVFPKVVTLDEIEQYWNSRGEYGKHQIDVEALPAQCYDISSNTGYFSSSNALTMPSAQAHLGMEINIYCEVIPMSRRTRSYYGERLKAYTGEKLVEYQTETSSSGLRSDVPQYTDYLYFDAGVYITFMASKAYVDTSISASGIVYCWIPIRYTNVGAIRLSY